MYKKIKKMGAYSGPNCPVNKAIFGFAKGVLNLVDVANELVKFVGNSSEPSFNDHLAMKPNFGLLFLKTTLQSLQGGLKSVVLCLMLSTHDCLVIVLMLV
jgi:hypothetical protein